MECFRLLNPNDYTRVWNDSFLKRYATALIEETVGTKFIEIPGC